ncbi:MAG: B12-binding domain-containing radical SAM protein [Alphaproteobacteria bacterium]
MSKRALTFCGLTATHPQDRDQYHSLCYAYLSAYARQKASFVKVVVATSAREAIELRPDVVGISAGSMNIKQAVSTAKKIKSKLDIPIILGGVHITALPHTLPEPFDLAVLGEGEETFIELMHLHRENDGFATDRLRNIAGLAFREGGQVTITSPRPPIPDLAMLPIPDRSVLPSHPAKAHMVTSRGCPYDCRFCSSKRFWGGFRAFPATAVLAEIDDLVQNYGAREVHFYDDLFVADRGRLADIADGVVERGYAGRIQFSCAIRAELAQEEIFTQLARMQMRRVTFGAESASPRVLRWLKGEGASAEANQHALDLVHRFGMTCSPSFIKGAPGETGDDLLTTYDFILRGVRERKIDYFEVHCLTPFPGTAVWDLAKERGLVGDEMDFDELRVPWEKLYLNDAMPKTSFYFFENLTQIGLGWLGLNTKRLVGIVDISHGAESVSDLLAELAEHSILDEWQVIAFHGEVDLTKVKKMGVEVGGRERLQPYLESGDENAIFIYLRPEEGIDADAVNRLAWWHYDQGADLTLHGAYRNFTPATPFERSLAAGNLRALQAGLEIFGVQDKPLEHLRDKGLRVEVYRPDEDPFTPQRPTARLFTEKLRADFDIDRPWRGRQKMIEAVEERIVSDAARLPQREARQRKMQEWNESLRSAARQLLGRRPRS